MNLQEAVIQVAVSSLIILILTFHGVSAWETHQQKISVKSEVESGSSLAERYLILGDWPASKNDSEVILNKLNFLVKSSESDSKSGN